MQQRSKQTQQDFQNKHMNYELTLQLKKAGFPQEGMGSVIWEDVKATEEEKLNDAIEDTKKYEAYLPTLSELIEACGDKFEYLEFIIDGGLDGKVKLWWAYARKSIIPEAYERGGSTPEEAVANLWLALNKK